MAEKKGIRDKGKALWIRGMKAIGNTAASIANNTRYKVDEVTIQNRRRELLNDMANKAYTLWLKGESFPEPLVRMLDELKQLDEQLNDMRAEKYASSGKMQPADADEQQENIENEEETEEEEEPLSISAEDTPVSTEINELFDGASSIGKTAQKVNSTLEQLSDRIRSFPTGSVMDETKKRQE